MTAMTRRAFLRHTATVGLATVGATMLPGITACNPAAAARRSAAGSPAASGPIRALGGRLIDSAGEEVRLTGVNWFGLETSVFAPHGLWSRNWQEMLDQIVATGFNAIRLPFSNQLLEPASAPTSIDLTKNPDLEGLTGLQLMDRIVEGAGRRGLVVVLDRHRPSADAQSELWYTDRVPERRWIDDWTMLADRYRSQPAVIAADLHNEPHGSASWGDGNPRTDWPMAAERAGNAILEVNPDWLIVVEGIERFDGDPYWWGGNLEGARSRPVRLTRPDRLVYSAHDYGPAVYPQPWFSAADFPHNLAAIWNRHWAWLKTEAVTPVLIGEFGGRSVGQDPEGVWQRALIAFLKSSGLSYTYWAWNPDSGDTGGVLNDDWLTLDRPKLDLLASYQWPRLRRPVAIGSGNRRAA
jgi:endoglucanase